MLVGEAIIIVLQLILALTFMMIAWPVEALANAGVPMLALAWPGMFISIIPVIIIESWYLHVRLKVPFSRSAKVTTISNLASAIIGIPLGWIAMLVFEMAAGMIIALLTYLFPSLHSIDHPLMYAVMTVFGAAWLGPTEKHLYWMVPLALIVLMIPFFYTSWWIENKIVKKQMKDFDQGEIRITTRNQNILSYGFLELLLLIWLVIELIRKHN